MGRFFLLGILCLAVAGCVTPGQQRVELAFHPEVRSVIDLEHCRPAGTAEALLESHGFHRESTFVRFETWSNRQGFRLVMGRLDGYLCVVGPEKASVV